MRVVANDSGLSLGLCPTVFQSYLAFVVWCFAPLSQLNFSRQFGGFKLKTHPLGRGFWETHSVKSHPPKRLGSHIFSPAEFRLLSLAELLPLTDKEEKGPALVAQAEGLGMAMIGEMIRRVSTIIIR